jgi:hypothetical protein
MRFLTSCDLSCYLLLSQSFDSLHAAWLYLLSGTMSSEQENAIEAAIKSGDLGTCPCCEPKWRLAHWGLRRLQLHKVFLTRLLRKHPEGPAAPRQGLCASCDKICADSIYIQGSRSIFHRISESFLLPLGLTGLNASAVVGCSMCALLCGTITARLFKEVKAREARGDASLPVQLHIANYDSNGIGMYLCIGGKAPYYIPITRIQHLAIRDHSSKMLQLKIKFTTALTFCANICEILIAAKLMTSRKQLVLRHPQVLRRALI